MTTSPPIAHESKRRKLPGYATGSPRLDTLLLVLLAGASLAASRAGTAMHPTTMAIRAGCELTVVVAVAMWLRRAATTPRQAKGFVSLAVGAASSYPFLVEWISRRITGGSEPLEMVMLNSVLLAAVVLAVFSHLARLAGTAVLLSSFLVLFATTIAGDRASRILIGVYGALGLWWLMGSYWDGLTGAFVASKVERRIPVRLSVIGVTGILLVTVAMLFGATRTSAVALRGFMPTSGGTRWHDPHARSGVGDGDAMVAAREDAMSFGPVESELFLESDRPTLYDMFNDMFGEPPKPNKKQERNIGLAGENVKQNHQPLAMTQRSGREFSAVRRRVQRKSLTLDDRTAPAMLYVAGRVPLHLALERFDTFDGRQWMHSGRRKTRPTIRLEKHNGKPWAYLMRFGSSVIHRGTESHAVKIINLKTNRFPSPPQLTAVHIDKVDQIDFFGWTDDDVACMPVREQMPQLTVIHLRSQGVNLQPLRETNLQLAEHSDQQAERQAGSLSHIVVDRSAIKTFGSRSEPRLSQAGSLPHTWRQVEAVVERLRTEFVLDPDSPAPEGCADVVAHFLQAKRGPAYLFATTAAVLLRQQGCQTRLVTGFYARRERFDHRSGQTRVLADDAHVWVEVHVGGNTWVAIEPTPGYAPPRESLTWQQWATTVLAHFAQWCARNLVGVLSGLVLAVVLILTFRVWLDAVAVGVCRLMGLRSTRARLLWTIRLLEWRAWLADRSRPRQATIAAWYAPLADNAPADIKSPLAQFLSWTDRLLYAPHDIHPAEHAAIDSACRSAASICTRQRLATNCGRSK